MELSLDQIAARDAILDWFRSDRQRFVLGGYAGTGKTTLISIFVDETVQVCAPTGKAAAVLRGKGVAEASTIHSLLYQPVFKCLECDSFRKEHGKCWKCEGDHGVRLGWTQSGWPEDEPLPDLVIVDEASMLTEYVVEDLEASFPKILYVGDHGQLPPIGKDPQLMLRPDIRLEQIHRQAEGNPIIQFAHHLRRSLPAQGFRTPDESRVWVEQGFPKNTLGYDVMLCGFNKTRVRLNRLARSERDIDPEGPPQAGDTVICLKNNRDLGLYNGQRGTISNVGVYDEEAWIFDFTDEGGTTYKNVLAVKAQFGLERTADRTPHGMTLFDYGYALTTHKAQGSEWDSVCVLEQTMKNWEVSRWRYTAATRAAKRLEYYVR